jgi:hypothetical protein
LRPQYGIAHDDGAGVDAQDDFTGLTQGGVDLDAKRGGVLNKSIKITLNRVLGPLLFLWLAVSVYRQVVSHAEFSEHMVSLRAAISGPQAWMLSVVLLLVFVNWAIEALKWQVLMRRLHPIGFFAAYRAVLTGLAFSFGTPNRVGDFGGRMLLVPEGKRGRSVTLSIFSGFSQLLVTLLMGAAGLYLLSGRFRASGGGWVDPLLWVVTGCLCIVVPVFLRPDLVTGLFSRLPSWTRLADYTSSVADMRAREKTEVFLLSMARFMVFGVQYCLMLAYMGSGIGWWEGFWAVAVFYLAMTLLPTYALLELGFRWQFSLLIFGLFTPNLLGVYAAATGIWVFNLLLPACVGGLLSLGLKPARQAPPA